MQAQREIGGEDYKHLLKLHAGMVKSIFLFKRNRWGRGSMKAWKFHWTNMMQQKTYEKQKERK